MAEGVRRVTPTVTDWITAFAAISALLLSAYSICRQRKSEQRLDAQRKADEQQRLKERQEDRFPQVKITTSYTSGSRTAGISVYEATVTNIGLVGVTIERVIFEPVGGGALGPLMDLPKGERQRKLEPGEYQLWEISRDSFQVEGRSKVPVTVVARDTAGKEHRSDPEDTLPLWGS